MYNISDNTEIPKSTTCLQQQSVSLLQLAESFSSYRRSGCIVHKLMTMPISTVVSQLRSAVSNYTAYGYEQCRSAYASSVRKIRNILLEGNVLVICKSRLIVMHTSIQLCQKGRLANTAAMHQSPTLHVGTCVIHT